MKTLIGEDYFTDWNLSPVGPKVHGAFEASNVEKSQVDNLLKKKKLERRREIFILEKFPSLMQIEIHLTREEAEMSCPSLVFWKETRRL